MVLKQSDGSPLPDFITFDSNDQSSGTFSIDPVDNALAGTYILQFEVTDDDFFGSGDIKSCYQNFNVEITKMNY